MGSESKISILGRLIGDKEWLGRLVDGTVCELFCGVLTTSAFMVSAPCRLMVWTSLSSRTVPLGLSFFGLEKSDMMGERQTLTNSIWLK